jgi:hypothetical protein
MKIINSFDDYIQNIEKENLHPKIDTLIKNKFPDSIDKLKNIILYGGPGIGKYSQALNIVKKYSPSKLKYEKKIIVNSNKEEKFFKISDVHFEIDLNLLGCNAKVIFYDFYNHVIDIISSRQIKHGIIICKNLHNIHSDLLEIFYSYMQKTLNYINITYILITENISFLPDNIINNCLLLSLTRPSKSAYKKCFLNNTFKNDCSQIENIKDLLINNEKIEKNHSKICDNLVDQIINYKTINFFYLRELIYELFTYNFNICKCIFYIIQNIFEKNLVSIENQNKIIFSTIDFFKLYNNNYRPIYHLEKYILNIIIIIHELQ